MFSKLLILFISVPIAEIYLLMVIGGGIGVLPTIGIVLAAGFVGAVLARSQGARVLVKIQESLRQGRLPGFELIEGALVLAGGILLLTPGFITDIFGVILLIPWSRHLIARFCISIFKNQIGKKEWRIHTHAASPSRGNDDSAPDLGDEDDFGQNINIPPRINGDSGS